MDRPPPLLATPVNRSVGGELEAQWLPTDDLMISLSYSHIDGNFEDYAPLVGPTPETTINTNNLAKRTSPNNMASGIVDWVVYRADWAEFIVHTEAFWQSKSFASALWTGTYNGAPYVYDQIVLDERTIVNLRLGMEGVQVGDGTCAPVSGRRTSPMRITTPSEELCQPRAYYFAVRYRYDLRPGCELRVLEPRLGSLGRAFNTARPFLCTECGMSRGMDAGSDDFAGVEQ